MTPLTYINTNQCQLMGVMPVNANVIDLHRLAFWHTRARASQCGEGAERGSETSALDPLSSSQKRTLRSGCNIQFGAGLHMGRIRRGRPGLSLFLSPWGFSPFGLLGCFMFNFSNLSRDEVRHA